MLLSQYFDHFLSRRKAAEACGMDMATNDLILAMGKEKIEECGGDQKSQEYKDWLTDAKDHANDQFFALIFIRQAGDRFEECRRELQNDFAKGTTHLPKTFDDAYASLLNYNSAATRNRHVPVLGVHIYINRNQKLFPQKYSPRTSICGRECCSLWSRIC